MSIRLRLVITYSAVLMFVLLIFSVTVVSVLHWALYDAVDRTLDRAINTTIDTIVNAPRSVDMNMQGQTTLFYSLPRELDRFSTSNVFVQVWRNTDGSLVSTTSNMENYGESLDSAALHIQEPTRRNVLVNGFPFRVLTYPLEPSGSIIGYIQAAQPIDYILIAQSKVTLVMIGAGLFALVVSLFLGNGLIERALRPIEDIASAASQIATGDDLSRRIPYDGPPDELGRLTIVFNATLGRLERLFMAQRRFVADVSHELRTPLTVIQGNADIIRRYGLDKDSLNAIDSESKRMTRLVRDLLLLAQADAGELPLKSQNLELDTLVLSVFEQAKVLAGDDGPSLTLARFEAVRVHADPDRLTQLYLNLVSNALKHTGDDGTVTLGVWPNGPEALVRVTDTGEGIPAEDLPHIFDRFYRVDKARARSMGGAGLGLAIAHWIAEAHGGRISVKSKVGQGTTFTVHLPRQIPPPEAMAETIVNLPAVSKTSSPEENKA